MGNIIQCTECKKKRVASGSSVCETCRDKRKVVLPGTKNVENHRKGNMEFGSYKTK